MRHLLRLLPLIMAFLVLGCTPSSPPHVSSIRVQPNSRILVGETALLAVEASGSNLKFTWAASRGTIIGAGSAIVYEAPDTPGLVSVTVKVTSAGDTVVRSLNIEVVSPVQEALERPTPTPFSIVTIQTSTGTTMVTPTSTPAVTPTNTPTATPTNTRTATSLPTMPLHSPTPTPEAVVVSVTGLNLRSGPGIIYDPPIDYLSYGEILDVKGRVASNEWIQVVPFADPDTRGWVSASPKYIQINVDLNTIPLIEPPPVPTPIVSPAVDIGGTVYQYEYGPILYEPKPWAVFSVGDIIMFTWERFDLKADQYYSVRVVLDVEPEVPACIHIQTQNPKEPAKDPEALLKLDCPPGGYYWSVVVATKLPEGSGLEWRQDSAMNHKNYFGIGMPHPHTPPETAENPGEIPFDE